MEPTSDDVKEVYARFGLAYYFAEAVHRGLCNLYCLSRIPPGGLSTRPRVEELLRTAFETTLGQLFTQLQPELPAALVPRLKQAVERRKFLAHHFWCDRIHLMTSASGIEGLLNELAADTELFSEMDAKIAGITEPLIARLGLSPDLLSLALAGTLSGEAKPLNQQRRPKKEERIVAAFDVPMGLGRSFLIFQAEDGALWQLCDVGLGWTDYETVDPTWPAARKFAGLLPAKVNPRPAASAPWTFEIQFGPTATLSVHPARSNGKLFYRLRRVSSATAAP